MRRLVRWIDAGHHVVIDDLPLDWRHEYLERVAVRVIDGQQDESDAARAAMGEICRGMADSLRFNQEKRLL